MPEENPISFECQGDTLHGIIHSAASTQRRGILIVVGGPQTRVGSHRQFVLLARLLTENGFTVMRFDYRGMGDSSGEQRSFQNIDSDIRCALDSFLNAHTELSEIVIWGLCDAASAAMFYGYTDERVKGLVLLNPDTLTVTSTAKTILKHYYLQRIFDRELWQKIFDGSFNYQQSFKSLLGMLRKIFFPSDGDNDTNNKEVQIPFPQRMLDCLEKFRFPILFILSGNDLTADAFKDQIKQSSRWENIVNRDHVTRYDLVESDHTFSSQQWRDQAAQWTLDWVKRLP